MGLLDGLIGGALGQLGGGSQQNPLLQIAMQLVQGQGGLGGLVDKFKEAGLAQQAASWVGTGENLPISGEHLSKALGGGTIASFAQQFGMSTEQVSGGLASLLPQVVDKLTPSGAIEQGSIEQQLGGLLKKFGG